MKNIFRLAGHYMFYYKKQTLSLLLGIALSSALLTGIGSLFGSGRHAATEDARKKYGDWHYTTRADTGWKKPFDGKMRGRGYRLEEVGREIVRKVIEKPYQMEMVYADQNYLDMMGREIIQGSYPEQENEVAMDKYTLQNLDIPAKIGSRVELDGEQFELCAIVESAPEGLAGESDDIMQVFVNETLDYGKNGEFIYLKFDETKTVYRQVANFCKRYGVYSGDIHRNNGLAGHVGGEMPHNVLKVIREGLSNPGMGLPYIWGQLNERGMLTERAVLFALGLFAVMIIYSLFQVTVLKRISQYSIMQAVGMTDSITFLVLLVELCMIFMAGYPLGAILGNGVGAILYQRIGKIFIAPESSVVHTGVQYQDMSDAAVNLPEAGRFYVNRDFIMTGAVLMLAFLMIVSFLLMLRMRKYTIRQMRVQETKTFRRRKIYSQRHKKMADILTGKFMFSQKKTFVLMLLSLSVGSIIFLGSAYVTENTKENNQLRFKADDGLGSDIQMYEASDQIKDKIPEEIVQKMEGISGLEGVHPVRYALGEIPLLDGCFSWPEFYGETANDPSNPPDEEIMEKYNGLIVRTGKKDYRLKVNIYGYDDEMLESLNDYVLEGEIDAAQMRKDNTVIFKTLMDGQGNYSGIDIRQDDTVEVRTLRKNIVSQKALRFEGKEDWYQKQSFQVAALVSRPLAKVDTYIGDNSTDAVDIIMTNEQMDKMFGVTDYQTVSITLKKGADVEAAVSRLREMTGGVSKCVIKDYSEQIAAQNLYLTQKMLFFYGIALTLIGISILHIINSMQHLVLARRREFGIIRAMGITDRGLCMMLAREGFRYGIYSSAVVFLLYFFVQKILYYFMVHIYLYLAPAANVSILPAAAVLLTNLAICVSVTVLSGRKILKEEIVYELRK